MSVCEKFPFHFIDINALVHIVWLVGTIQPMALLNLLDSEVYVHRSVQAH